MSSKQYTFTVFTPAYNRAHTLERVYRSLDSQSFRDFEWLIVDDGSTDKTGELIGKWKGRASFPIHYIRKENGGKHTASNLGVVRAKGKFFLTLDSDDEAVPEALERFYYLWNTIPEDLRSSFSAVSALCKHPDGSIEGSKFPQSPFDSNSIESHTRYKITGEKWGFQLTDIMRSFPFPEFPGEYFIPEGVVWNRIALKYKTRYVNDALRIYHQEDDSLSSSSVGIRIKSPLGSSLYYNELSEVSVPVLYRIKAVINYLRFSFHGKKPVINILSEAKQSAAALLFLPVGYLFYCRDMRSLHAS